MLTKLLKYDFKATGRIILPIAGGVLLLNFVSDLLGHFVNNTSHTMPWVGVFMGLLTLATFLGMLAVLAICFFASVQRYYKLLGEQGYLMLALPVHAWQHIAAKLICGVVWTLFGFFYFGICGTLTLSALDGDSFSLTGVNIGDVPAPAVIFPPDPCTDCRCPAARLPGLRLCGDVYPASADHQHHQLLCNWLYRTNAEPCRHHCFCH